MIEFKRGKCGRLWGWEDGKPSGPIYTMEDQFFEVEGLMGSYEKIATGIYGSNLKRRDVLYDGRHRFSCFFIVQHAFDSKDMSHLLSSLLFSRKCSSFHFFGERRFGWQSETERLGERYIPEADRNSIALTIGWDQLEEMIHWMTEKEWLTLPPHDCYLIYDDEEMYRRAKEMIARSIREDERGEFRWGF